MAPPPRLRRVTGLRNGCFLFSRVDRNSRFGVGVADEDVEDVKLGKSSL